MGWGQPHDLGAGTTGQIEEAHKALDLIGVRRGILAIRVKDAVDIVVLLRREINQHHNKEMDA